MNTAIVRDGLTSVKSQPFAALPHDLVSDPRLSARAVRVAAVLLRYARDKAECWPSNATIAAAIGRSVRTVQTALRELVRAGWLAVWPTAVNRTGRLLVLAWRLLAGAPGAPVFAPRGAGFRAPPPPISSPEGESGKETQEMTKRGRESSSSLARSPEEDRSLDVGKSHTTPLAPPEPSAAPPSAPPLPLTSGPALAAAMTSEIAPAPAVVTGFDPAELDRVTALAQEKVNPGVTRGQVAGTARRFGAGLPVVAAAIRETARGGKAAGNWPYVAGTVRVMAAERGGDWSPPPPPAGPVIVYHRAAPPPPVSDEGEAERVAALASLRESLGIRRR